MLLDGLGKMTGEEKVQLLALLRALSLGRALRTKLGETAQRGGQALSGLLRTVSGRAGKRLGPQLDRLADNLAGLEYDDVTEVLEREKRRCLVLPPAELDRQIMDELAGLVDLRDRTEDSAELTRKLVVEAAKGYKIEVEGIAVEVLEPQVFRAVLAELLKDIRRSLRDADLDALARIEQALQGRLEQLGWEEKEHIRQELGLEQVSARILLDAFRTGGGSGDLVTGAGPAGFGVYAALTAVVQAVYASLVGVTVPFAVYTGAASLLALMLSPLGWLLVTGGVGGVLFRRGSRAYNRRLAAIAFMALKVKETACPPVAARGWA